MGNMTMGNGQDLVDKTGAQSGGLKGVTPNTAVGGVRRDNLRLPSKRHIGFASDPSIRSDTETPVGFVGSVKPVRV